MENLRVLREWSFSEEDSGSVSSDYISGWTSSWFDHDQNFSEVDIWSSITQYSYKSFGEHDAATNIQHILLLYWNTFKQLFLDLLCCFKFQILQFEINVLSLFFLSNSFKQNLGLYLHLRWLCFGTPAKDM